MSIKEIQDKNYNLDFKNPNKKDSEIQKSPKGLVKGIAMRGKQIAEILKIVSGQL